ncbi:DMT family transporter [Actibacterium ureilyticum]|uniref:DMT family transporter n=1 Tax=Actibacterium ureilyticum TaxID=1590614 RepID=UPI001FEAC1C4|nr:DMT family transporter [Actibacterium ureilyticum]
MTKPDTLTADDMTGARDNLTGAIWMVLAMAGFAVEDALLKAASVSLPKAQVLVMFGLGGVAVFTLWALASGAPLFTPAVVSRPMRIRAVFEVGGRLFYLLAIALTPLSAATAILQATPVVVVAGAALVFGEKVGWRRWSAICVGLIGVLLVLRPGSEAFSALSILAVLGMLGFAGRDLASRAAPASLSTAALGFYGFWAIVLAGAIYALWEGQAFLWPAPTAWACMAGAVAFGVFAYGGLMRAMRTGEVSAVTPFRYSRLIFGLAIGLTMFNERIDMTMLLGCGLIVLSGLYILMRGNGR